MTTLLVHQSKTRKKACTACVKAKRRCDLLLPVCSRCDMKNLGCVYVNEVSWMKSTRSSQRAKPTTVPVESSTTAQSAQIFTDSYEACLDSLPYDTIPLLDYQDQQSNLDLTSWNSTSNTALSFSPDILFPITNPLTSLNPQTLSPSIDPFPSPYSSLQFPPRNTLNPAQITYISTQLKSFVSSFALHSHNSFIHPVSFHNLGKPLPTPYADALSICALHTLGSPHVFSILDSNISDLISSSEKGYWRSSEWLIVVQVLNLYQIIRLWSSNERQKINAERHIPLLMQWTNQLQMEYVGLLAQGIDTRLPTDAAFGKDSKLQDHAERWVLLESIRRAVMISMIIQCLYGGMKNGYIGELLPVLFHLPVGVDAGKTWESLGRQVLNEHHTWEHHSDDATNIEYGEIYAYKYWSEGWTIGIVGGGEMEQEIYERMLLVACASTRAIERWGGDVESEHGEVELPVVGSLEMDV
ncbi:uncharacterized protein EAF01_006764 [Botrytis porri]|uniref:Zn(2)-C6 fungal-type domain-containing protein n=1 Tax=Botrytis porri TaxID=87229 RepID=A0A4Z1KKJ1_9HELO|nr:uncharacterized protein EAF01_006764 [Botrytis porri]KAF7903715.1 hypothetical protein EAF01_006764 [Botrytis porri]TGO86583.1 hypothetical protein BPOR_0291g00020 [Botrytis porri]